MMKVSSAGKNIVLSDFDEVDALRLAMKLEKDGIRYYSELEAKSTGAKIKKTFARLVNEESKHLEKFGGWLEGLGKEADEGIEEGEFDFIDTGVFGDIWKTEDNLKKIKNDLDAVSLGEWAELNSINFYKAMCERTTGEAGKKILKDIIAQEQEHLKAFMRYKELLEKNKPC